MNLFAAKAYLKCFFSAQHRKGYGIHSPFLFNLITKGLSIKLEKEQFSNIEKLRSTLLNSKETITVNDLGAGSKSNNSSQRLVSQIARTTLTRRKYAGLLVKLIQYFSEFSEKEIEILELGTSLGITTLYLASNENTKVTTVEGDHAIGQIARGNFTKINAQNIHLLILEFSKALNGFITKNKKFDILFIDGNHRYKATKDYFEKIKLLIHNDSILIFDDIHWSKGMQQAWHEISADNSVSLSLDVFQFGILFFKKELSKQHFVLRY